MGPSTICPCIVSKLLTIFHLHIIFQSDFSMRYWASLVCVLYFSAAEQLKRFKSNAQAALKATVWLHWAISYVLSVRSVPQVTNGLRPHLAFSSAAVNPQMVSPVSRLMLLLQALKSILRFYVSSYCCFTRTLLFVFTFLYFYMLCPTDIAPASVACALDLLLHLEFWRIEFLQRSFFFCWVMPCLRKFFTCLFSF